MQSKSILLKISEEKTLPKQIKFASEGELIFGSYEDTKIKAWNMKGDMIINYSTGQIKLYHFDIKEDILACSGQIEGLKSNL